MKPDLKSTSRRWGFLLLLICLGCAGPARTGGELRAQATALNDAGYQYYRRSRLTLAQEKFTQALAVNRLIDRRDGIAANLNNLGIIALELGDADQAVKRLQEALAVNRERNDADALCETLNNLGLAYQAQGKLNQAREAYQEALEQARRLPPKGALLPLTLVHLGDTARLSRDFDQALNLYHQALRLEEERRDPLGPAVATERLGRLFLDFRDYDRALVYLKTALAAFRRLEDTPGIIQTLETLVKLALAQGDREEGQRQGRLLLALYQARGQEQQARKLEEMLAAPPGK